MILGGLGITDAFAALTSGKEVPRSKPDPAIYLLACRRLGVAPQQAVAIEDSGPGGRGGAGGGGCAASPCRAN